MSKQSLRMHISGFGIDSGPPNAENDSGKTADQMDCGQRCASYRSRNIRPIMATWGSKAVLLVMTALTAWLGLPHSHCVCSVAASTHGSDHRVASQHSATDCHCCHPGSDVCCCKPHEASGEPRSAEGVHLTRTCLQETFQATLAPLPESVRTAIDLASTHDIPLALPCSHSSVVRATQCAKAFDAQGVDPVIAFHVFLI